ncbi:MAG: M23 family metallopeptidase [Actinobacteria bacterium]|nr:M23 family metallopeptidase [Actinomycetota bacterium]
MARLPFPKSTITGVYGSMSEFRRKNGMQAHSGTDFAPAGSNKGKTVIPAVAAGTVRFVQWSNVLGWVLVQTAYDSAKKKTAYVGYCHLACKKHGINCKGGHDASLAITLKAGDKVAEGDAIGTIGNTGSASSGAHLHLTISWLERGVFGSTADKFDFVEWVEAKPAEKKQTNKKTQAVVPSKVCPSCKQEIK